MGAFCVFGISRSVCKVIATKKAPTTNPETKQPLSLEQWAAGRDALTDELFETLTRRVKISPEFDAPQFCRDWLSVDHEHVKEPVVMVRGPKHDKQGNPVIKDGKPVETWLPYESECERLGLVPA